MQDKETTMNELMDFLQENMATKEDLRIMELSLRNDMATKKDLADLRVEMGRMEHRILDTMDDKLSDLKGDLVVLMRKEDTKLVELIDVLRNKNVINNEEANRILGMQPFPQIIR
jgi:hypothetical protein